MISKRPQAAALRRRADGLHAWVPTSVLILGLGAVAALVSSKPRLSPSALRDMSGTAWGLNPVGGRLEVFKYEPISPFSPDIVHRSWLLTIILTILYLGSTAAIGSVVVGELRSHDSWPRPVSAIAGFLPGYLMLLAPLQVLLAAAPVRTASWIALTAVPISAVALHWRACSTSAAAVLHDRRALHNLALTACAVTAMSALAMVHRLQVGQFFLTQDSIQWFLRASEEQLRGDWGSYLAQWNTQSDEWVFNAPLVFSSHNPGDVWFPYYATQCVSLVSLLALVFGIVHRLARQRKSLAAGLATAVTFGSTLAIYPWLYVTIVAGGQPLVQLGHPGRHVGIIAPWIALLLFGRQRRAVTIALTFATLGLGFVSVHVLLDVLAALVTALIWRAVQGSRPGWIDVRGFRAVVYLLPAAALGATAGAFLWVHQAPPLASAMWWLALGGIIATGGAFAIGATTVRQAVATSSKLAVAWSGAWLTAVTCGLLLANNLTWELYHGHLRGIRSVLGAVLPGYDGLLLTRGGTGAIGQGVVGGLSFPSVSEPACQAFIQCGGLADFMAAFGVLFILVLVTWISFGPLSSDAVLNARRAALLIMVAGLDLGLVIVFFTGAPSIPQAIIYSRFLEIPYYGLLALAAMTFAESRNRVTAIAGTSMLVLWTVIPLIATEWPQQMARNAGWYLQRLF
ncbi:MAG TPA: hypothetical protein VFY45_22345 [Baekduia sp.]|nr:hypothetical protein [Baekduia sp.]